MRVAAVDIGTNTTRLLIAEAAGDAPMLPIDRRTIVTRLGQGVDAGGVLIADAIDRTVAVLSGYGTTIREAGCDVVRAVATSASRDAANRSVFLDAAANALGVRPEVISGADEAGLSFAGTTNGLTGRRPFLVIDPGGGSTEFVLGSTAPEYVASVDIGSVRLTERLLPDHPASEAQLAAARLHVDGLFEAVTLPHPAGTAVGVGGTYTSLGALHLGLEEYDSDLVHCSCLGVDDLRNLVGRLAQLTIAQIEAIPALDPARAPVLLGGAVVAERSLRHAGVTSVVISEHDILDGIALSLAA